jgi:hypothetical protein
MFRQVLYYCTTVLLLLLPIFLHHWSIFNIFFTRYNFYAIFPPGASGDGWTQTLNLGMMKQVLYQGAHAMDKIYVGFLSHWNCHLVDCI